MLVFAGKALPSYIKVNKISYSVLSPIEHKTAKIQGRMGRYDFGVEYDMKTIEVEYQILAANMQDVMKKASEFSTWLFYKDLQKLEIADQPDRYYMARIIGDTDITETYRVGSGTLTFIVPSGVAESKTLKSSSHVITTSDPVIFVNNGTTDTYPVVKLTMKQNSEVVSVISDEEFFQVGDYPSVEKESLSRTVNVLSDSFSSYSGWSAGLGVDGGTITGTFASDGIAVGQSGKNYGTGTGWHGAAGVKSLTKQVQDFQVQSRILFDVGKSDEVGRIEIYLFDANNAVVGKFSIIKQSNKALHTKAEARVGTLQGGTYFVNSTGTYNKKFKRGTSFEDKAWAYMSLARMGNKWRFYFADIQSDLVNSKHYNPFVKTYTDFGNKHMAKVAKIQIHVATYSTNKPINRLMFSHINVVEINDTTSKNTIDLLTGDEIVIDNERGIVTKNGEAYFQGLNPVSRFFKFERGANGLIVDPPVADLSVEYRERFL